MCGIFGIMSYKVENKYKKIQETAIRIISTEILQLLEERGGDATGVAALFNDCNYMGLKMGISATEFISLFGNNKESYEGWLDLVRKKKEKLNMLIGHCRKSSVGNTIDDVNNHPIHIENKIIGVHNGTLSNHEAIFHNLECKRDGIVDSEAIFRLLYHFLNKGTDPFTNEVIQKTCQRLHGTYSVIALNSINPNQLVVFRDGRPLVLSLIKKLNILLIASEEKYIKHALFKYNKLSILYKLENDFTIITKKDVSIEQLKDDHLAIFDNRVEITEITDIKSLIRSENIPRVNKVWKNKIIENKNADIIDVENIDIEDITTNDNNKNNNTNCSVQRYTNNDNSSFTLDDNKKVNIKKHSYLVSLKNFDKLTLIKDDKFVNNLKGIEIDIINSNVYELLNNEPCLLHKYSKQSTTTNEQTKKVIILSENTHNVVLFGKIKTSISINDINYVPKKKINTDVEVNSKNIIPFKEIVCNANIEKHNTKELKIIKLSENAYTKVIKRYNSNKEAMKSLNIHNESMIKKLPFYSLCNRIKRFIFKEGFCNGYIKRKDEEKLIDITKLQRKKIEAEKKVRVLKTLSNILNNSTVYNIFDIDTNLKEALNNSQEIDSNTIKSIYSSNDLKKYSVINKIITILDLKSTKDIKKCQKRNN